MGQTMTPLLTDRTTIETDLTCGQKRFWYKHAAGRGIVPAKEAGYFRIGREVHHDMSRLAEGQQGVVEDAWAALPPTDAGATALEPAWRRVGWLIAAQEWFMPVLMRDRKVAMVERELVLDRGPLWIASTADLVLEFTTGPYQGQLEVIDYKTTPDAGWKWQLHWPYAIQMHLQIKAVEEETGQSAAYARVIGLLKGRENYGRLHHPYVWGYTDQKGDLFREYRTGLSASPLWNHFATLDDYRAYVLALGPETGLGQFPSSHPIFYNDRLVTRVVNQTLYREYDVKRALAGDAAHDEVFRMSTHECRPSFGDACPYLAACHNAEVNLDPIASGLYVARTPHHDIELIHEQETDDGEDA
jgi:hypothetical protein